jgi:sensor domain CHASE-containing protein
MPQKRPESLKTRLAQITLAIIVVHFLVMYASVNLFVLKSFEKTERDQTTQEVQRASGAIDNLLTQLNVKLADWASWDDTYAFVEHKSDGYIESNLGINSIANLKIHAMLFANSGGDLVFTKAIELKGRTEVPANSLVAHVLAHKSLLASSTASDTRGIVMLSEGPMLVVALPILTSNGDGPFHGTLLFGKYLNADLVAEVTALTHLSVHIYTYDDASLPADVALAKKELSDDTAILIKPLSGEKIAGYRVLRDIYNTPALILRVESPRVTYNQGLDASYLFILATSLAIGLLGTIVVVLLNRFIVYRFATLSREVSAITNASDFTQRVSVEQHDEIGVLAEKINVMLEALSKTHEVEKKLGDQARKADINLQKQVLELENVNKLMVDRELKMVELKQEIEQLKARKP